MYEQKQYLSHEPVSLRHVQLIADRVILISGGDSEGVSSTEIERPKAFVESLSSACI
jgi:hypothetical protein